MPSCCVKTCPNRGGSAEVTFHKVPFKMKDTWYKILSKHGMKNVSVHMVVCSDHFKPQDLDKDGFRTILKKGAVPCVYLDKPSPQSINNKCIRKARRRLARVVKFELQKKMEMNKLKNSPEGAESIDKDPEEADKVDDDLNRNSRELQLMQSRRRLFDFASILREHEMQYPPSPTPPPTPPVRQENVRIVDVQAILRSR